MKVNYVLMYGIPYVRYKEFETFEDISKFLVHKGFVNYSIFKKLEDKEEIEMIYRDNDIHYLENIVKEQDKEIERLNKMLEEKFMKEYPFLVENGIICKKNKEIERLHSIIKEVREYIEKHKNMTQGSFNGKEWVEQYFELVCDPKELLEILDKGSNSNE